MIARRLRDKQARGEPITIENFVIDTIVIIISNGNRTEWSPIQSDDLAAGADLFITSMNWTTQFPRKRKIAMKKGKSCIKILTKKA